MQTEVRTKIEESDLEPETRSKILEILSKAEFTPEDSRAIQNLIQEDLEKLFAEVPGLNEEFEKSDAFAEIKAEYEAGAAEIEKDLQEAVDFSEEQANLLSSMASELKSAEDALKLEEVKGRLGAE